jgi:myo-inositol 2-dehydrogenase/D-chiro-inositol 1-dehydrogenase
MMGGNASRIALAGFGAWGQMHAQALATIDGAEIVSVYCHGNNSEKAASELLPSSRRFHDYEAMLAAGGFDVVDVTVPNFQHARFAVAALEAGADVFLEKPLGLTLAECDAVIDTSRRTGRQVALNHELRVSRQWGLVRDLAAKGELGRVRYQHFSLFRHPFRQGSGGWRYDPARVGSWILEELVHFFDLVMWYAAENGRPTSVHTFSHGGDSGLTDNLQVVLRWPDDSLAVLSQCLTGFEHHTLLEVAGDKGAVRTWWSGARDRTLHPDFELKLKRTGEEPQIVPIPQSGEVFELRENLRQALEGFRQGRSILAPDEAGASIAICLAAEESAKTGAAVAPAWPTGVSR